MMNFIVGLVTGFLIATIGLTGIVGLVDNKVSEVKEAISK